MSIYCPELVERAEITPAVSAPVRGMIRLLWGAPFPNFGDLLSPLIVKRLSGCNGTSHKHSIRRPKLFALGSSLGATHDGDVLWGSGSKDHRLVRRLQGVDVRWISVMDHPHRVIDAIRCCEVVLSSSLHGLTLAEAYGIPACFMETPVQGRSKYEDYYASTGRDVISYGYGGCLNLEAAVEAALKSEPPALGLTPLLLAFPYLRTGISCLEDLKAFRIDDTNYEIDFPAEVPNHCHPDFQQCAECHDRIEADEKKADFPATPG